MPDEPSTSSNVPSGMRGGASQSGSVGAALASGEDQAGVGEQGEAADRDRGTQAIDPGVGKVPLVPLGVSPSARATTAVEDASTGVADVEPDAEADVDVDGVVLVPSAGLVTGVVTGVVGGVAVVDWVDGDDGAVVAVVLGVDGAVVLGVDGGVVLGGGESLGWQFCGRVIVRVTPSST